MNEFFISDFLNDPGKKSVTKLRRERSLHNNPFGVFSYLIFRTKASHPLHESVRSQDVTAESLRRKRFNINFQIFAP